MFMQPRNQNIVTIRLGKARSIGKAGHAETQIGKAQVEIQTQNLDPLDADAAKVKRQHGQDLPDELDARAERPRVVDESQRQDDHGRQQYRPVLISTHRAHRAGAERFVQVRQDRPGHHAECQRQPTEARNRSVMDPAKLIGPIDRADPVCDPGDERRGQNATHHRHGEDHEIGVGNQHGFDHPPQGRTTDDDRMAAQLL